MELDSEDPTILKRPFTAEQIRDEWVEGFTLTLRRTTPEGEATERWTVLEADDEGTVTEYFFARDLPGAPVSVRTTRGEKLVLEMVQLERLRPPSRLDQ